MSAEGLMGPFALNDPAAGTTGPWYTNGTFGLTAGWHLDIWGKNRAEVTARLGTVKARAAEREQTRQLLVPASAKPESPRCVSGPMACYCKGSGWMPPFNSLVRWAGVTNADDMCLLYLTFIQR